MKHIWLKSAMIGAGVIFVANGSFAANEWSYADGKITKGGWSIAVTYDAAATPNAITLGAIESAAEDGILDMRTMTVGGAAIEALTLPGGALWKTAAVKEFYVDHVVNTRLNALLGADGTRGKDGNGTVTRVEVTSDTVTYLDNFVQSCTNLHHLVLNCSKLHSYGETPFYNIAVTNDIQDMVKPWTTLEDVSAAANGYRFTNWGSLVNTTGTLILTNVLPNKPINISTGATNVWIRWGGTGYPNFNFPRVKTAKIELPNVVSIGGYTLTNIPEGFDVSVFIPPYIQSFMAQSMRMCSLTGTLTLTNLTTIVVDNGLGICYRTAITGGDFKGPVESMGCRWQQNGSAWTNVSLDCPRLTNILANAESKVAAFDFDTTAGVPLQLKIYGPVEREGGEAFWWTQSLVDNILFTVKEVTDYSKMKMTFYCSRKQGWDAFAGCMKLSELAEEERAMAPEGCFGVYKTAAGAVKAWMVHMPQDTDPTGLCIRIR